MRILTVRQPWAHAIIHQGKDVENRVRNIAGGYRGLVAIHAGLQFDLDAPKSVQGDFSDHPYARNEDAFGAIIGVVDLVGVHRAARHYEPIEGTPWMVECTDRPCCAPWGEREVEHLVLSNPRPLAEPIPYRGALGLRHLDGDTTARILAQIGAS